MKSETMTTDFAVAAYLEEGRWEVLRLPAHAFSSLHRLVTTLRGLPGDCGALAMVGLGDEVFVIVRVVGPSVRLVLSDAAAESEWELAEDVVETLQVPAEDDVVAVGDMAILADMGLSRLEVVAMCEDLDLYPEDVFTNIAARLGFRPQLEETLEAVLR